MDVEHSDELRRIAEQAVVRGREVGVPEVRAVVGQSRYVTVSYRGGRPDKTEEALSRRLTLDLYCRGRYARSRTSDLRRAAVDRFVAESAELCRATAADECLSLPEPDLCKGRERRELELFDPGMAGVTAEDRRGRAAELEAAAAEAAGPDGVTVEASYADSVSESIQLQSNGFEGARRGTRVWTWVTVTLADQGEKRPQGWAEAGARCRRDLAGPATVAADAVETARARLGAVRLPTEKLPMIVHRRAAGRLVGFLVRAASGAALHQQSSFLAGQRGQPIASPRLNLVDDPFVVGGFGSRLFDGEGIAARLLALVEAGVLQNFYLDTFYARKLKMSPTTGGTSNLTITPGTRDLPGLISDLQRGVLVRGFVGGNCNGTTGDFSLGVYGTLIERGQLTANVAEMNIAGNMRQLWQQLVEVGSDPYPYSTYRTPSLVFDAVQFSGT